MRLAEALSAVGARTGRPPPSRRADNPALWMRRLTGREPISRTASWLIHRPIDVERAVLWLRLIALLGPATTHAYPLRRAAQDVVPAECVPGWVVLSGREAWFQVDAPVDLLAVGVVAVRVHDDCACESS